jgi:DNA adenine methylase
MTMAMASVEKPRDDQITDAPPSSGDIVFWTTRSDITPLRYPGGKRKLGPFIADLITKDGRKPKLIAEPFAGGASVSISLLEAGYAEEIALNDLDELVAAFWSIVFSRDADALAEIVENAEVSVPEWYRMKKLRPASMMEAAFKCLFLNRTSFSGSLHNQAGPMGGRNQAKGDLIGSRFNKEKIAKRIRQLGRIHERVRSVTCGHYSQAIRTHGSADTLWYLDPPFFAKADRLYRHHFDEAAHNFMCMNVTRIKGRWILSYDDHADARRLYGDNPGFARIGLQYTAAVGETRQQKGEIVVSDIIARRRATSADLGREIEIPRRSVQRATKRPRSI